MPGRIQDNLQLILAGYADARETEPFGSGTELWGVFNDLKNSLESCPPVRRRPDLRVAWSAGKGNWAKVPWVAVLDAWETGTTQGGVYCVYLFREDMSGVYLTFSQGVTEPKNEFGRQKAHENLRAKAANIRGLCDDLGEHGFRLDDDIDLRADRGLGVDYEASTIAHKLYEANWVPDDEVLLANLEAVLGAYDRYLADDKWRDALDLCRVYLDDRGAFDEGEIEYKLRIAARIQEALDLERGADGFGQRLRRAFSNSDNNLTNWQDHDQFTKWAMDNHGQAQEAIRALAGEGKSAEERVDAFLEKIPDEAVSGPGTRISVASYLLMGRDPKAYMMYKPRTFDKIERALGWPRTLQEESSGAAYAHHLRFARRFLKELQNDGLDARDLLDAQSLIWMLATDKTPAVALWRGDTRDLTEILDKVESWVDKLGTRPSVDGSFHHKPLLLLALLDVLDADPRHANRFAYEELRDAFMGLASERGSTATEEQFSQPYLRTRNDRKPQPVWIVATEDPDNLDDAKANRPSYVRSVAPSVALHPFVWPAFKSQAGRNAIREAIQDRWGGTEVGRPPPDEGRWFEPLADAPAVEAELQKLLDESGRQHKEIIGAIFRRAITLHRRAGTDGFLGAQPRNRRRISVMAGNLYTCAVGHDTLFVLVDNDPTLRRAYDVGEANSTRNHLMWVQESPNADGLSSVLRDENVWKAYERMLAEVTSFPVARRNHNNRGKLNVVTGKRLDEGRSLADLADELLVDEAFLVNALALLRDKGQVIFYGPPGTGKTFVARKLMEYLAPEEGRREVVQFHPSYSYEDFVHGYRPVTRVDGALAYELMPGPLMRLARQASEVPGEHVLLVDEINRGNLPKILGELLYLLEYREDKVVLMYGEEEARFSLPEDLLIIGTMNTADRSIALIDAAMRRRFHFVPFFPNEWPLEGLLRRWLQRHRPGMAEVAEVVDRLNAELRERFGPHLQVGPSHFMKKALDEAVLQRVWDYDVMPFLEDQLFGQEEELEGFKLERLRGSEDADHYAAGTPAESGAPVEGRGGAAPGGQEDR